MENKKIRFNFNPGGKSGLKWRLNEGPNDIRMTVQQYLSRYKYQEQFKILKVMRSKQGSQISVIYLSRTPGQLCLKVFNRRIFPGDKNRFHNLLLIFEIKGLF